MPRKRRSRARPVARKPAVPNPGARKPSKARSGSRPNRFTDSDAGAGRPPTGWLGWILGTDPVAAGLFAVAFVLTGRALGVFQGSEAATGIPDDALAALLVVPLFLLLCRLFVHGKDSIGGAERGDGTISGD